MERYQENALLVEIERFRPETGLVLGSGLGGFIEGLEIADRWDFGALGLPVSTVPGHRGEVLLGRMGGHRLMVFSGRVHLYEGHGAQVATAGIRLAARVGVSGVILTNAAGTLNADFHPGSWMMLSDHLNLTGQSPLTGGPNFVDMSAVYDVAWRREFLNAAGDLGMTLHGGVYAGLCGPQYETPAEIRMLRTLGADAVGMSTVLEAIQARALGLRVAAFSCLTNWAAGMAGPLDHSEVMATGKSAAGSMVELLSRVLRS